MSDFEIWGPTVHVAGIITDLKFGSWNQRLSLSTGSGHSMRQHRVPSLGSTSAKASESGSPLKP